MYSELPNLTVQQLLYVQQTAHAKTLTEAADTLGVTQSALSQGIAEVERRLGVSLFEKRGRGKHPTAALFEVADVAKQVIASIHDLQRRVDELATGERGELRLGMIDTVALGPLANRVRAFRTENPEVKTTLVVAPSLPLTQMVESGELDLAVVVIPNPVVERTPKSFLVEPFSVEQIFVYAPPSATKSSKTRTLAARHWGPWVSYPHGSQSRSRIESALSKLGASLETVAESSNPDVLRQMVLLDVGWCALPSEVAESGPNPLKRFSTRPLTTRQLGFVARRTSLRNATLERFMDLTNR